MLPLGFETTISAGERPQTHALGRAATGTGDNTNLDTYIKKIIVFFSTKLSARTAFQGPFSHSSMSVDAGV